MEEGVDNHILSHEIKKTIEKMNFEEEVKVQGEHIIPVAKPENEKGKKVVKEIKKMDKREIPNFAGDM